MLIIRANSTVQVLLIFLLLTGMPSFAQRNYSLQKWAITQADGLPDRNVNCGIQDRLGYLWFGTRSGLCQYDGTTFTSLTKLSHGLRGSAILSLSADDSAGIIIQYIEPGSSGTPDEMIDVVDIHTHVVSPFSIYYPRAPFKESDVEEILYTPGKPVQFLLKGNHRYTWRYTHASGFKRVPLRGIPIQTKIPGFEKLTAEQRGQMNNRLSLKFVLTADSSLFSFGGTNNRVLALPGKGYLIPFKDALIHGGVDQLCFLDLQGNVYPLDSAHQAGTDFNAYQGYLWSPNYNHNNTYISLNGDAKDAIIEMQDRNIVFYSAQTGFTRIFEQEENMKVRSFFTDRLGAWWLCTNAGIYKIKKKRKVFDTYFTRENPRFSFNNSARGIYVDDEVLSVNLYDAPVIVVRGDTLVLKQEQNFAVTRIQDALWIGQYNVSRFDLKTRAVTKATSSVLSEVWSIFPIADNRLLLGCSYGLATMDMTTDRIVKIDCAPFPAARFVYKILRNAAGQIMAAAENGIYVLDNAMAVVDFYSISSVQKGKQLPCNGIHDLYQDRDDIYWIGSSQEGLFRWDKEAHTFQQFGIENGFLSTAICNIQEDNQRRNLWVSTDYGLTRFNMETKSAVTYTRHDGISDNEFNRSSSFQDRRGRMYFGGMNGVTSFNPEDLQEHDEERNDFFLLRKFTVINSGTGTIEDNTRLVLETGAITLNGQTKLFACSFALLDYERRQHLFAYKVEGLDTDWHYTHDDHLELGNLPYGNYRLKIKAQLASGDWHNRPICVAIAVPAPFYRQWWFMLLTGMLLLALIGFVIWYRTRSLKRENFKLEHLVSERTQELQASLSEQKAMLQEIHHRVKNNLQFIEAIINMQIDVSNTTSNQHVLKVVSRRISAMTLVHEMLYTKESVEMISVKDYIRELTNKLSSMMEGDEMAIKFNTAVVDIHMNISSCLALGMITTELVSNSIKHGFKGIKDPEVAIELRKNSGNTYTYMIRDNGSGLSESGAQSNGLGMRLIDIFVRQMKGKHTFRNENGLVFTLDLALVD